MKTMAAGKFKNECLKALDEVARDRTSILITKRGRPVARLVPLTSSRRSPTLRGSIIAEHGDPFSTGEVWNGDRS
jgi:prevent-host-death family protein